MERSRPLRFGEIVARLRNTAFKSRYCLRRNRCPMKAGLSSSLRASRASLSVGLEIAISAFLVEARLVLSRQRNPSETSKSHMISRQPSNQGDAANAYPLFAQYFS